VSFEVCFTYTHTAQSNNTGTNQRLDPLVKKTAPQPRPLVTPSLEYEKNVIFPQSCAFTCSLTIINNFQMKLERRNSTPYALVWPAQQANKQDLQLFARAFNTLAAHSTRLQF
jgi:hypothetical protein